MIQTDYALRRSYASPPAHRLNEEGPTRHMTALFLAIQDQPSAVGPVLRWSVTVAYLLFLGLICLYGLHRYWLVWLFYRHRRNVHRPARRFDDLPVVTVQLPMFNEAAVAERIIDAACRLEYPVDKLEVQVLDDSTDDSADIARRRVELWQSRGVDIHYLHRSDRVGFKAGALEAGLQTARGQLIAVFDADFIPEPGFLKRCVHHFTDQQVGMVQTCWSHLNRDDSLLTRSQAIFLDGHFVIEHTARNRAGRWINFNGTGGVWRRQTIQDAGGWQHDTLTEDVDLSYRAQLAGWRFVFLPRVKAPAELPPEMNAFKSQQHRWTKGSIQTARKLLPRILGSDNSIARKVEAFFHLTSPMVYLYLTCLALLFYPAIYVNMAPFNNPGWSGVFLGLSLFGLGTISASVFYIASQRVQRRSGWQTVWQIPNLMAIGVGIAVNNARGCLEALLGQKSDFVRTPKYNTTDATRRAVLQHVPGVKLWMSFAEIGMGLYMLVCAQFSIVNERTIISLPFLLLFAAGYLYVGLSSLTGILRTREAKPLAA